MPRDVNVLLVSPRFLQPSFWSLDVACWIGGGKCPVPPLGLITVAALLPERWRVRLLDCNVDAIGTADLDGVDLVMVGAMIPQRPDALRVIELCRANGTPVVVGGPDVTSSPEAYENADFRVLGEAENIIGRFIEAFEGGASGGTFETERFQVDVTRTPIPRYDLLNFSDYTIPSIQFSRGCPFNCEFCDIIELYGRVPRTKTNEQMVAELDALLATGYRGYVFFVDDNLIGNKKAVKAFLPALRDWQAAHGYPFEFVTQASVNMADDEALLTLMKDAPFTSVFIGIETPNAGSLVTAQKKQNTRRDLADSIHRIYGAGITVMAGFILGFDDEPAEIGTEMADYIEAADLPLCMIGLLTALPETQMWRRLSAEGRLSQETAMSAFDDGFGDQCSNGLNFTTARPRREILKDYLLVLNRTYATRAFEDRVRRMGRKLKRTAPKSSASLRFMLKDIATFGRFMWVLGAHHRGWIPGLVRTMFDALRHNPPALREVVSAWIHFAHIGPFAKTVAAQIEREIAALDADDQPPQAGHGRSRRPRSEADELVAALPSQA